MTSSPSSTSLSSSSPARRRTVIELLANYEISRRVGPSMGDELRAQPEMVMAWLNSMANPPAAFAIPTEPTLGSHLSNDGRPHVTTSADARRTAHPAKAEALGYTKRPKDDQEDEEDRVEARPVKKRRTSSGPNHEHASPGEAKLAGCPHPSPLVWPVVEDSGDMLEQLRRHEMYVAYAAGQVDARPRAAYPFNMLAYPYTDTFIEQAEGSAPDEGDDSFHQTGHCATPPFEDDYDHPWLPLAFSFLLPNPRHPSYSYY